MDCNICHFNIIISNNIIKTNSLELRIHKGFSLKPMFLVSNITNQQVLLETISSYQTVL